MTFSSACRDALLDAIDALINTGSGTAVLEFQLSNGTEVATLPLNNPAFEGSSGGIMYINTTTTVRDTSATGNASNVTQFVIKDRNGTIVITGDVADDGSATLNLNTTLIPALATVQVDSFALTAGNA